MCNTGLLPLISPFGRFFEDFTLSFRGKYSIFSSSLSSSFHSLSLCLSLSLSLSLCLSLSLSLYNPFTSLSLSYISLPLYISFSLAYLMDVFVPVTLYLTKVVLHLVHKSFVIQDVMFFLAPNCSNRSFGCQNALLNITRIKSLQRKYS